MMDLEQMIDSVLLTECKKRDRKTIFIIIRLLPKRIQKIIEN